MNFNVTDEQIVKELIAIFLDEERKHEYQSGQGPTYQGICGWCGVMAPLNRIAFVGAFGLSRVEAAEKQALETIEKSRKEFENTNYAEHVMEANANAESVTFTPYAGCFVWSIHTGLKNEGGGLRGEIADMIEYRKEAKPHPHLTLVEKVFCVSAERLLDNNMPDELVKEAVANGMEFPGGARNEDETYVDLKDEYRTYFTLAAAVLDDKGRWFLIDSEGYDYARYILLPLDWDMTFEDIKKEEEAKIAAAERERQRQEKLRDSEEKEAYLDRCDKWKSLMIDIQELVAKEKKASDAGDKEGYKVAARKKQAAQRKNITTMIQTAFPGLKVSVKHNNGWGAEWEISYVDGPTKDEFDAATDLDLFAVAEDRFDGMTDSAYVVHRKLTTFADRYMCCLHGDSKVHRECSNETEERIKAIVLEVAPESEHNWKYVFTNKQIKTIGERLGIDLETMNRQTYAFNGSCDATGMTRTVFEYLSLYTKPEPKSQGSSHDAKENAGETPVVAEGEFKVIDYNERCIVVIGDTRPIKDKLKSLGKFNSRFSCGAGWCFSKRNKENLKAADELLGGIIAKTMPELLETA